MKFEKLIKDTKRKWQRCSPAKPEALLALKGASEVKLPEDYLTFLSLSNGGEGEIPVQPLWFQIWPAEMVLEHNKGYEVSVNLPGFWAFGSNGGGEMLAFDTREGGPWRIMSVPFIPMDADEAVLIAKDFMSFVSLMGKSENEASEK